MPNPTPTTQLSPAMQEYFKQNPQALNQPKTNPAPAPVALGGSGPQVPGAPTNIPVPKYGDPVTDSQGRTGTAAFDPNTGQPLPRVTPQGQTAPIPQGLSGGSQNSGGVGAPPLPDLTPPPSEDADYQKLLGQSNGLINSINSSYNSEITRTHGAAAASIAAAGLGGSSAAPGIDEAAVAPVLQQRDQALGEIYNQIEQNAETLRQHDVENYQTSYEDAVDARKLAKQDATDSVKAMAAAHLDWNAYKQTNPDNYNALVSQLGGDPNYADALFASSIPPQTVQQTWVNGSTYNQLVTDPVTGKPSIQSYDLGVKIPQNWTSDKIGTNAVIYHGPNWDPTDPSTYQIFGVDPATGLPTSQVGGATNPTGPAPVSDLATAISSVESSGSGGYDAVGPVLTKGQYAGDSALGKYQIVPSAWFDQIGLDPTSEDDKQTFLNSPQLQDQLFNTIIGSLNAQYPGNQGKAIAAYFGGSAGADAYGTPKGDEINDGNMSINQYVQNVQSALPQNSSAEDVQAQHYANDILNGSIPSLTSVPKAYKDKVSALLDSNGSGGFSPLAGSRFTMESNRITSNYVNLPAYQLTAGGQLYLGRIAAAEKTPGSISDQDLLDSLTKLNTGGNAISDAQVKLITDGKSFSDAANVWKNKLANGGVLSDSQRQQVQTLAKNIFKSYQDAYQPIYTQVASQLQAAGIPKAFWTMPDLNTLTVEGNKGNTDSSTTAPKLVAPADVPPGMYQASDGLFYPK